jgi:hypothetical protein
MLQPVSASPFFRLLEALLGLAMMAAGVVMRPGD